MEQSRRNLWDAAYKRGKEDGREELLDELSREVIQIERFEGTDDLSAVRRFLNEHLKISKKRARRRSTGR